MYDDVGRGSECEHKYGKLWGGVQILGRREKILGEEFRYWGRSWDRCQLRKNGLTRMAKLEV